MNKQYFFVCILAISLGVFACKSTSSLPTKGLQDAVVSLIDNWDKLEGSTDLDPDIIFSWLPERGIRGRYHIAKQELSKAILENFIGEKAFLTGPHDAGLLFTSATEFGHYNPLFLTKLQAQLSSMFLNKDFVRHAQPLYDQELKQYLRTYYLAYEVSVNQSQVMASYEQAIAQESPSTERKFLAKPSFLLQESFREFSNDMVSKGYDDYEAFVCPGFWVRRSIDGTEDEFFQLLSLTMNTFDKEFLN